MGMVTEGTIKDLIWAWAIRKSILLGQESVDDLAKEVHKRITNTTNSVKDLFSETVGERGYRKNLDLWWYKNTFKCKLCGFKFSVSLCGQPFDELKWVGDISHKKVKSMMLEHLAIRHSI